MSELVIVESPAKAKTIEKYLGKDFSVVATMGHLRDLPKSVMGVDLDTDFSISYQPIAGKEKIIEDLKKKASKADHIYLATDPDREGEAISWHVKELLNLPDAKTRRVTFNEITKRVVQESIAQPRSIDAHLVDAQQARRALDRIVGYKLSPLLWRKVRPGLSAGRVQSVATRLVVDREEEIRAFVPREYWSLDALMSRRQKPGRLTIRFHGDAKGKIELNSEAETQAVMAKTEHSDFVVLSVKQGEKKRSPAPPFITSTLQQEASRKLNMNARRAMAVAQQLYEGIDIEGQGLTGLITYMRTDSLRLSDEAVTDARRLIASRYGKDYLPAAPLQYKAKKNAQDAHEAIRPSDPALAPEQVQHSLTPDQYKLYKMIWDRFTACQMANAVYDTHAIEIESAGYRFRANHSSLRFTGFMAVYVEGRDDEAEEETSPLPDLMQGEILKLESFTPAQHFTQPPARYTEASLIRALEEQGIGRPSTYAPTLFTIQDREYVRREGKALHPTPLGEVITTMMKLKFTDIIDVAFTARMEENLDQVAEGHKNWQAMLRDFYGGFSEQVTACEQDPARFKVPDEPTDVVCEQCGKNMVIKMGRFGRFMACPGYPECKNAKPITEPTPGECPVCGAVIVKKKSRNNRDYYGCEKNPECPFMTWDAPLGDRCPHCSHTLFKKSGRGANKPFCANPDCVAFVPEDQRGYKKKAADTESTGDEAAAKKAPAKKAPAKKTTAAKTTAKTSAKKAATTKTTSAKTTKTPAKTTAKTTAARKKAVNDE